MKSAPGSMPIFDMDLGWNEGATRLFQLYPVRTCGAVMRPIISTGLVF